MKRLMTGFGVAAAFGLAATLSAQTPASSSASDKEVTITGCLERGANGNYTLANAKIDDSASATSTTTGTTGTTSGAAGTTAGAMSTTAGTSWTLEGGSDLDKHVGHKIQVTGKEVSASKEDDHAAATTTATGTATGTSGTTTATGTTGTTGGSEVSAEQKHAAGDHAGRKLDVKSVKMISATCS
jgi:hypothetical protein